MELALVFGIIGAIWAGTLASNKNLNPIGYALAGFFLPLIGVLIAYGAARQEPRRDAAA